MDGLLTTVSTSYTNSQDESFSIQAKRPEESSSKPSFKALSPSQALEILKAEPDYESLVLTLRYLREHNPDFSITSPSPLAAQLVHVLVSDIVPTYGDVLFESNGQKRAKSRNSPDLDLLLSCLRSVTGLNALLLGLKQLIQRSSVDKKVVGGSNIQDGLAILLRVLIEIIREDETVAKISKILWTTSLPTSGQKVVWNEFIAIVGSGKILGLAAEAEDVISNLNERVGEKNWIADGSAYSNWLARNISYWARDLSANAENEWKCCGDLLCKALRLGYAETVIKEIVKSLLLQRQEYSTQFEILLSHLPNFEQRNFIYALLKLISRDYLSTIITSEDNSRWWQSDTTIISAAAALIQLVLGGAESRKSHLVNWLVSSSGAGVGDGIAIRRAAVVALIAGENNAETILDKSLRQFGDQLYIRHTPTMQQEVHAQVLLLSAGYVHRLSPLRLSMMMRSGSHLSVVSNRLAASSPRARFLGMVVGEALSNLVDKGDKKMDFKMEEMSTLEAKWYKSLVTVLDTVGHLEPLKSGPDPKFSRKRKAPAIQPTAKAKASHSNSSQIISIEEISGSDGEESENDRLTPYAKPDSDEEDSDEDPTLITRNKPTSPVYIRDLIKYFRDTENYDKQKSALQTAAPLIRRKAKFGTEVSDHAEELATLLMGLQDKYDIDNFAEMKLQGMIAVLIALPLKMGQWFSKTFFDGDYSLSQRASVLTTLGLGARELGRFSSEGTTLNLSLPSSSFPSKALPEALQKLYVPTDSSAVDKLSTQLSNTMIAPMAAELADRATGPAVLKVRTFSSRMEVEKKRKKPIANELAKVVAEGFFFPLTGRFFIHLKAYGSSRSNVVFQPYLLTLFIKTLALLIHASGPSTLSLPQMTSEFWDLLLSLRTQSIGDITVVEALLFAFLTLLEINDDKRSLVENHGRQLLETQEWIEGVFGQMGSSGSEEDNRVRMLAAGCLVRISEVVEKYQVLLMGDLVSF